MSAKKSLIGKVLSGLLLLGGVVLLVSGGVAWNMASSELSLQKINVAEEGQDPSYANGPFDALKQIDLIQEHTAAGITGMGFAEGTVYTDVPMPDSKELAACKKGESEKSAEECGEMMKNDAARSLFDNSNFKQASLYTSVIAFGVSALVMGLGIVLFIVGSMGFLLFGTTPAAAKEAEQS